MNGDGIVNKEDFVDIVQRFETVGHATARQVEQLQDAMTKVGFNTSIFVAFTLSGLRITSLISQSEIKITIIFFWLALLTII